MFYCLSVRLKDRLTVLLIIFILSVDFSFADDTTDLVPPEILNSAIFVEPVASGLITEEDDEVWIYWTATGDDHYSGRATGYDIRYRTASYGPIDTDLKWRNAIEVIGEPVPSPSGQLDSMLITDLIPGESYYFCIKSYDDAGNYSGLSNSPIKTLPGAGLSIEINSSGGGYVDIFPEKDYYNYGEVVYLFAHADSGWDFLRWSGSINSVYNPIAMHMTSSFLIIANFISEGDFLPGDANADGDILVSDVTYLIQYFRGEGPAPVPFLAGDCNGDCMVTGTDVTYVVFYFRGYGPPPVRGNCDGPVLTINDIPDANRFK